MVTIGHGRKVTVRISEQVLEKAKTHVAIHTDKYDNLSHFIRAAVINKLNQEV